MDILPTLTATNTPLGTPISAQASLTPKTTLTLLPTSPPGTAGRRYHMIKIHNRYPFKLHVYVDGVYLMSIPSMKYMTYNAIKEGWRVFTFAKVKKKKPVDIVAVREINVTDFTEIWIAP